MPIITQDTVWAGTEQSLHASLKADENVATMQANGQYPNEPKDEPSRLLSIHEGIATLAIKGTLTNDGDAWWNEMTGRVGYPEIRDALLEVANDASVSHVVLDIDSGGGSVAGVADTGSLIRLINDSVKPVVAFTDGAMMSAAYWLGASAGQVFATKSAMVGSIGVIATHMERSKMLQDAGIGVTVVRSGPYKALANSVEPLTAEGKAQIQKSVDAANGVFVDHIAEMRNTPTATVDKVWGEGREFLAAEALDIGMVDAVTTFDSLMSRLIEKASVDTGTSQPQNRVKQQTLIRGDAAKTTITGGTSMVTKRALTEQDIAALAAGGVVLDAAVETTAVVDPVVTEPVVEAAAPAAPVIEAAAPAPANLDTSAATIQLLNSQLAAKDAQILEAGIKISKLDEQLQAANATHGPMLEIVGKSINNMQVAMGGSAIDLAGLGAVQVLAEHTRLSAAFAAKFPVGGVSAVEAGTTAKKGVAQASPAHMARVNAARFSPK